VLALAGLKRLGRDSEAGAVLDELVPAAGQGALAIEGRAGELGPEQLASVHDARSAAGVAAERELTRALGASCNTAVGARAEVLDTDTIELHGWVGALDGSAWLADRLTGPASQIGAAVAQRMLAAGAGELLAAGTGERLA
jgi:hydroxymethylbilane synthase